LRRFSWHPLLLLHLDTAGSFPKPLTAKQERETLARYFAGDMQARAELIEHNLRLVAHIIKKYYTQGADQDDLISIGTIGLIKGISTYRPVKGVRLATYASRCVENEILMYFRREKKTASDVSLSDSIDTDKDGNSISLMDILSTDEDMFEDLSSRETRSRLTRYLTQCLTEREAEILAMRYGLGGGAPLTQREAAAKLGISRSYVSRIEKKALQKLRKRFEEEDTI
jgi:RNA polymerase sporulation-specific sigma factor